MVAVADVAVRDDSGDVVYIDGMLDDITERKKMEEQLKEIYEKEKHGRQELEEEAKARGLFIDVLAHELRTPVTPILVSSGMLQELLEAQPDDIQKKLAANIHDSTQILARRLEELLDLARYTRGAFKLNPQPINTSEFLGLIAQRYKPALEQKQQQ